jgi:hypothetical protein
MKKKPSALPYYLAAGALLAVAAFGFPQGQIMIGGGSSGRRRKVNPDYFSRFYNYDDVTRSNTAEDLNLSNEPNQEQINAAQTFAQTVLDPIATFIGEAPRINSWFRSSQVNSAVGGSTGSDHLTASAADVSLKDGNSNYLIVRAIIQQDLPVDQVILYGGLGGKKYIHLGQDVNRSLDNQRRQILERTPSGYAAVDEEVITEYFL